MEQTVGFESLIHPDSLGATLDALNAAFFYKVELPAPVREETAAWIAAHQGLPGAYAGMFAPEPQDCLNGYRVFTGEPIRSDAALRHILSEEACRLLFLLQPRAAESRAALRQARANLDERLGGCERDTPWNGVYCCGTCTAALWRHFAVSADPEDECRIALGLGELYRSRDDLGRWRRFPFYYTLLALTAIDLPAARAEIQYAVPAVARALSRASRRIDTETEYDRRRRVVMETALEKC